MNNLHNPTLRVISILNLISLNENLNLTEISKKLKISKSTLQPILKSLVALDYIKQDMNLKTYRIGVGAFRIGMTYVTHNDSLDIINNFMIEIVQECNEICQLGVIDNANPGNVFYVKKEEPSQPVTLKSNIGSSLPAHATALGKCLLSSYDDSFIRNLYKNGMEKVTDKTISNIEDLLNELEDVRIKGYAIEREESAEDIMCIAIPLFQNNKVVASLSVSIPTYRSSDDKIESIIRLLLNKKKDINSVLIEKPFA